MAARSRRTIVTVAGLLALLLAGTGAYLFTRDIRLNQFTQSCGSRDCIPGLQASGVTEALKKKGHSCKRQEHDSWYCDLVIGSMTFKATISFSDGYVYRLTADVFHADNGKLTKAGMAYLTWFATLPYRDDPATSADITKWLAEQVAAAKDTKARIADYEYVLLTPQKSVELDIRIPS
ncbi:hypothetical protein [Nonomuraea phyllanthi]|uniref:hypothetical protein n=1 Tax=Nonomuraea phyllanthi TaxID=2219224 RepID=UPI001884AA45|nr:hypothetical protein [Nonomuraea phyllanthi]